MGKKRGWGGGGGGALTGLILSLFGRFERLKNTSDTMLRLAAITEDCPSLLPSHLSPAISVSVFFTLPRSLATPSPPLLCHCLSPRSLLSRNWRGRCVTVTERWRGHVFRMQWMKMDNGGEAQYKAEVDESFYNQFLFLIWVIFIYIYIYFASFATLCW